MLSLSPSPVVPRNGDDDDDGGVTRISDGRAALSTPPPVVLWEAGAPEKGEGGGPPSPAPLFSSAVCSEADHRTADLVVLAPRVRTRNLHDCDLKSSKSTRGT